MQSVKVHEGYANNDVKDKNKEHVIETFLVTCQVTCLSPILTTLWALYTQTMAAGLPWSSKVLTKHMSLVT